MNKKNNPLRLNVGYLYNKPIGSSREVPIEIEQIEIEDLAIRHLKSRIRISRIREGLLLQVSVEAEVLTDCVRCLNPFSLSVDAEFEDLYQFPSRHREETDQILPHDGNIDMRPNYREYLILSLPIKRLCRFDCEGLCMICGVNLNQAPCEHHPGMSDEQTPHVEREEQI